MEEDGYGKRQIMNKRQWRRGERTVLRRNVCGTRKSAERGKVWGKGCTSRNDVEEGWDERRKVMGRV